MKKEQNHPRKLTLNRETIRALQETELREALGGAETRELSCDTVTMHFCYTVKTDCC